MSRRFFAVAVLLLLTAMKGGAGVVPQIPSTANRLVYLDETDPFYPNAGFPKLITPQWIGEAGVEAVVILAIDDMRDTARYEGFLRPIIERLQAIDGRAPVSIMTIAVPTNAPHIEQWLTEGLSLEVHTLTHPCPLLQKGNFQAAADVVHGGVDLLRRVSGSDPVAFRMPCCDSMNSPSPRFFAEIFNHSSAAGAFLTIDSSVMNLPTAADAEIPRSLIVDGQGRERFRKYLSAETNEFTLVPMGSFSTTIENYPYPYIIGKLCWEFPAVVPSDWEARNVQGTNNPVTVADWKAALDITVLKKGTFNLIFHPNGWIRNDQIVELIDYADRTYGKKVKFLTFREAQNRINQHLLSGFPLRDPHGDDNGVRLLDVNHDGFMDVVIGNGKFPITRIWQPAESRWEEVPFPTWTVAANDAGRHGDTGLRFGVRRPNGFPTAFVNASLVSGKFGDGRTNAPSLVGAWTFNGKRWEQDSSFWNGLTVSSQKIQTRQGVTNLGTRMRDADNDGRAEVLARVGGRNFVFGWVEGEAKWQQLPYALPTNAWLVDAVGRDNGVRFVDLNGDGFDDLILSNEREFAVHLFIAQAKPHLGWERGWSYQARSGRRGDPGEIPMIVREGEQRNNGAWFRHGMMWVQNEDTAHLADKVDRRSFQELVSLPSSSPKTPEESLKSFRLPSGFKAELVASEPLVVDPVAFDWGADGKFWVVEMNDYPLGNEGKGGTIKFLEDTNGDGKYDKATIFLDHIPFPNGVMAWGRGVLISASPRIFYAEDSDGDGEADIQRTLLEGFKEGNQQHRVNGFEYGLDHWIYAANGDSGGAIRVLEKIAGGPPARVAAFDLRGHDLRFRPDTGEAEPIFGQTQFGRHRDDWGNWFGNNNPTWLWHYYMPDGYLTTNGVVAIPSFRKTLANYPDSTRVFPASVPQQRFNWPDAIRQVTSANSPTPYRDVLFGPDYTNSVFISEPANNVIHREVLIANDISFVSSRAAQDQKGEFLASSDNWFRPTMMKTGPDGALYIADMYRLILEHPEYFPEELKKQVDVRRGEDRGRIYRIFPEGVNLKSIPVLQGKSTLELVETLESANGWQRDMAQRLLIERKDPAAVSLLRMRLAGSPRPLTRLHALYTLSGFGEVKAADLELALRDAHWGMREHALRLAEPFLETSQGAGLMAAIASCVEDSSLRVRYQLAFSLSRARTVEGTSLLAHLASQESNVDLRWAILSSAEGRAPVLAQRLTESKPFGEAQQTMLEALTSLLNPRTDGEAFERLLRKVQGGGEDGRLQQWTLAIGWLQALRRTEGGFEGWCSAAPETCREVDVLVAGATKFLARKSTHESEELIALRLVRDRRRLEDLPFLAGFLEAKFPAKISETALEGFKGETSGHAGQLLVAHWLSLAPSLKNRVQSILLSRTEWCEAFLEGIDAGTIAHREIGLSQRQQLMSHHDAGVRDHALRLFTKSTSERDKVVREQKDVLTRKGNAQGGHTVFLQHCAACHQFAREGARLGPDLGSVSDKSKAELLTSILDPNRAVDAAYLSYDLETRDGREWSGIIAAESSQAVTLRMAGGIEEVIPRTELKKIESSKQSPMPDGFENILSPQEMSDLLSFLVRE